MGCPAFLCGLRGTLVARGFCGRSLGFVLSKVRLPNFLVCACVSMWRAGVLGCWKFEGRIG
jgi:hypothetical protein